MVWECRSAIAALREQKNLTQLQLAQEVGVTETTIANWEKGRSGLEWIDRLIRLCAALECTPEDLIRYVPRIDEGEGHNSPGVFSEMLNLIEHGKSTTSSSLSKEDIERIEKDGGKFSDIIKLIGANKACKHEFPFSPDMTLFQGTTGKRLGKKSRGK
ncbi:MAG: helix-turn-helix transcriptional regulator [Leptolyngbya sp. SIO1E4]|nr:helix-turn-helix transcriptional regulator [Leptolyngbya sp. SIO1E4]